MLINFRANLTNSNLFSTNIQFDEIFFEHENNMSIPFKGNFNWSKPVMSRESATLWIHKTIFHQDQWVDESGLTVVESMPQPEMNSNLHRFDFSVPIILSSILQLQHLFYWPDKPQSISTANDVSYLFFQRRRILPLAFIGQYYDQWKRRNLVVP